MKNHWQSVFTGTTCKLNRLPSRIDPETPLAANG